MINKRAIVLALLAASFAFLFKDVLAKLVYDWGTDDNYSHGFLVVPLAAYVVWRCRAHLASLPVRPSMPGLVVVFVSLLTLVAGMIGAELFLTRFALLGTLGGTVMFVWGARHLKELRFPFLLLALAIPIPAIIFNQITFPLQLLASRFGEFTISACQIPVLREGNVIILATTSLEVVEACSGIRSLTSLLTMAVILGYLTESPSWLRWLLALSSVPIAIFANGIRVAGTGVAVHFVGPGAAEGFLHTFSGWLVFVVAGVLLLGVHRVGRWLGPATPTKTEVNGPGVVGSESAPAQPGHQTQLIPRSLIVTGCLVLAASTLGAVTRTEAVALRQPLRTLPQGIDPWRGSDGPAFDAKVLATLGTDDYINRSYVAPGQPWVSLYVGYYRSQRQGQTMHSPLNCMPGAGWEPMGRGRVAVSAPTGGAGPEHVEINRLVVQKGRDRQLVLYWYQAHGRIVASEYWGKIYTVVDAIRLNRSDGALVRVIVPISSQHADAEPAAERAALEFVNKLLPVLSTHLDGQSQGRAP
jgi:exosortase D (VPLPA-CTERM-specific)